MKEKDRYELQEVFEDDSFHWCLKDNDTKLLKPLVSLHNCVDLLNQQAQRIKELEETLKKARQREVIIHQNYRQGYIKDLEAINELQEENQQLNEHIKELELLLNADEKMKTNSIKGFEKLKQENQQLKQSQKQLAINELEKIRQFIVLNDEYDEEVGCNIIKTFDLLEDISDRIKNLKEEYNG